MNGRVFPRFLVAVSLLVLCAAAVGCGRAGGPAATIGSAAETSGTAAGAPQLGQLAFEVTERLGQSDGRGTIWLGNTDGTGLRQIAACDQGYRIEHPGWSPDGQRIAYDLGDYRSGTGRLPTHSVWVMNSDGTGQVQLTHLGVGCLWPAWSPDGSTIAFGAYSGITHEGHIALMGADGSGVTTITTGQAVDVFPDWTPEGRVVFLRKPFTEPKTPGDLFVVNADGTGLAPLTSSGNVGGFALSPDGSQIAFHDTVASQIKLMPTDGSAPPTVLVDDDFGWVFAALTWSPDGRTLAIGSSGLEASSGDRLYVVNADGSGLRAVPGVDAGLDPAWRR